MNTQNTRQRRFIVQPDHPCLAGHFPGQPLVPAVVMLDEVAVALREWHGLRLSRIVTAKFLAPLLPGEAAELQISGQTKGYRFRIQRGANMVAQGTIEGLA